MGVGDGGQVLVGGQTAVDLDVIKFITDRTPIAVGFVVLVTYLVLFLLTGSVVLPLKAVVLNFLSIGASFGALVWIFQQGHLSNLLNFTPQSIDPSIPVILFSIVFGLSMDYEVLLVSRIHEEYVRTGDNTAAVAAGLERSGRLITGAAAIMVTVFLAFGLAEVVIIKAIGIGLAIAVAIDATIVRALVVPAVMRLLGDFNWWAPRPLRWLHERAGLSDLGVEEAPAARTGGGRRLDGFGGMAHYVPMPAARHKWVYHFTEGSAKMRDLLGGKGAGAAEMTRAGMPVPPGFTITTEACRAYYAPAAASFPRACGTR